MLRNEIKWPNICLFINSTNMFRCKSHIMQTVKQSSLNEQNNCKIIENHSLNDYNYSINIKDVHDTCICTICSL